MKKTLLAIISVMMMTTTPAQENPFLTPFATPHGTAPFNEIRIEHCEPAFEKAMAEHQAEIDRVAAGPPPLSGPISWRGGQVDR